MCLQYKNEFDFFFPSHRVSATPDYIAVRFLKNKTIRMSLRTKNASFAGVLRVN